MTPKASKKGRLAKVPGDSLPATPEEDTIAAIATPVGQAGIGIIRISGPRSLDIARALFRPRRPVNRFESHHLYLGHLYDPSSGETIDEVLLSFMQAPRSYTREDVVEINSHSGYVLLSTALRLILEQGARPARPGEFTLRAFLNGRIDLTQAEAVVDLINCRSERGLRLATRQVRGALKQEIEALRKAAVDLLAHAEVAIDFPEEEADIISREQMAARIKAALTGPARELMAAHARKRIWVDGVHTAIVGRVNAGKSSLLNRLLDEQRAIVTPIPGTTRDLIESTVTIEGVPLRLVDTAGLRRAKDAAELAGVQMTARMLEEADFLLVVVDRSRPLSPDDRDIIRRAREKKALVVLNKLDLPDRMGDGGADAFASLPVAGISALTGEGLTGLRKKIAASLLEGDLDMSTSHAATNLRHRRALEQAAASFMAAGDAALKERPMEIIAFELRRGLDALGEITGETPTEKILENIFSRFCLGK